MALQIDSSITAASLLPAVKRMWALSAEKISNLDASWPREKGTPVFTCDGTYTTRGWTEWTEGFQHGASVLQFDATGETRFLELARRRTQEKMASHVSHMGVHDHGFNNVSTYGALHRLAVAGRFEASREEIAFYELALKVSGAVQAARWSRTSDGRGFIYSFNGPQSLFIDTVRSLRSLIVAHTLGHALMGEQDRRIDLLERACTHGSVTAAHNVYYGRGRDAFDIPGRVAHESLFNPNDGQYRCPSSQQGYSPFSTWTRGLAWALCGFSEQLQFLETLNADQPIGTTTIGACCAQYLEAARVTAEFYLGHACADGVPFWDTGAPNLWRLEGALDRVSDPFNAWEPVDSSAAAIAAQGFMRLAECQGLKSSKLSKRYRQAGLNIAHTLLAEPYLSTGRKHQGLLLHSVYHRPNGWDHVRKGQKVPNGESSMWGDYHLRELALLVQRAAEKREQPCFFKPSRLAPAA